MTERSVVTGTGVLEQVAAVFDGNVIFLRGFSAGIESETRLGRLPNGQERDSPITLLAEMPAWEGSHRSRGCEQDFSYSVGALVGAFAARAGIDTDALFVRLASAGDEQDYGLHDLEVRTPFGQPASLKTRADWQLAKSIVERETPMPPVIDSRLRRMIEAAQNLID